MFCTSCGAQNDPGTAFCTKCGTRLGAAPAPIGESVPLAGMEQTPSPAGYTAQPSGPLDPRNAQVARFRMDYATWGNRVVAYLIDFLLVAGGMLVLYLVAATFLAGLSSFGSPGQGLASGSCCLLVGLFPLATFGVGLYNKVYLVSKRGYSIGQGVMKLKVVDAQGNLLSTGTLVLRLVVQAALGTIPFVGLLDLLWPLWDVDRQTLHDKAVGSFVINNPSVT
jgi:uncharacterized RDD family membrane protein YckC